MENGSCRGKTDAGKNLSAAIVFDANRVKALKAVFSNDPLLRFNYLSPLRSLFLNCGCDHFSPKSIW